MLLYHTNYVTSQHMVYSHNLNHQMEKAAVFTATKSRNANEDHDPAVEERRKKAVTTLPNVGSIQCLREKIGAN